MVMIDYNYKYYSSELYNLGNWNKTLRFGSWICSVCRCKSGETPP